MEKKNYCDGGCEVLLSKKEIHHSNRINIFAAKTRHYCGAYNNKRLSTKKGRPLMICSMAASDEEGVK